MPEFSIIVPIYKVEKYLEICIDSIIGQSFCNFELILVDDGSPDTCGEICDRYSSSDTRVKVVHKENGGLSSARNAGLDIATGKYVIFIDSDDFWDDASALEHIHINLTETDADVLVFTAKRYYESEDKYTYIITSDVDRTKISNNNEGIEDERKSVLINIQEIDKRHMPFKTMLFYCCFRFNKDFAWMVFKKFHLS